MSRLQHVAWVERRGAAFLPGLESDTHQSQFAKMKMMGFAKGSTHPTGWHLLPTISPTHCLALR
ncbi:MAG TPA: hypothetical protein VNO32_34370 [Candidatus Acidoferrum sp.]|nr:hypothetical protein [Candidatus Acidoferrum sp.]